MAICLTFDDGCPSHFEWVGELLREYHFQATFFLNGKVILNTGWENFLGLRDFEIGNHLYRHQDFVIESGFRRSTMKMQEWLLEHGFGRATSLAYPGFHVDDMRISAAESMGFEVARGGIGTICPTGGIGPLFDIDKHSRWNIPCTYAMGRNFGFTDFIESDSFKDGSIFVLHGFDDDEPMSIGWNDFRRLLDFLADTGYPVLGLTQLWRSVSED